METKVCSVCGKELPIEKFGIRRNEEGGHCRWCKDCENKMQRERYKRRTAKKQEHEAGLTHKNTSVNSAFEGVSSRELLKELKNRGYVWTDMQLVQRVSFDKI